MREIKKIYPVTAPYWETFYMRRNIGLSQHYVCSGASSSCCTLDGYTVLSLDRTLQIYGDSRLFRVLVLLRMNTNGTVTH
jgi:hypothetical protein